MSQPSIRLAASGLASLIAVAFLAAACSSAATAAPASSAPVVSTAPASAAPVVSTPASNAPSSASTTGVVVTMATTSLGPVLTGPSGLTLYTHTGDTASSSTCTGGCATAWPPLAVATGATATAGTGVSGTLGTLTRADGTTQVTYNGMPLYGWQNDAKAGDVTGQGVNGFLVAKP